MAGTLEAQTRQIFENLDRKDVDAIIPMIAKDAQAVDELSRHWLRGGNALSTYFRQAIATVSDIHSELSDFREVVQGDIGFVTCWLEQDYTLEGKPIHVSAPTTLAFRREKNVWMVLLIHTVPLAPD